MGGHYGATWVDMEVVLVVLKDEAAGSGPQKDFRAAQAAEMGRKRERGLTSLDDPDKLADR